MKAENAFIEFESDEENTCPEIFELNIISGGCHIFGYLLSHDTRIKANTASPNAEESRGIYQLQIHKEQSQLCRSAYEAY